MTGSDVVTPGDGSLVPRGITPAEAHALLQAGRAVLADVRDSRLYDNAHPAGAVSLPLAALEASGGRLPDGTVVPDDAVLIFYCA
jgi:rhodanese-related sulfurtransferase